MRAFVKSAVVAVTLAAAPAAFACEGEHAAAQPQYAHVATEELFDWLAQQQAVVIDVNSQERFEKGHIPTAVHMTYDGVTAAKLPADKDARLVFYCYNERCQASHKAALKALDLGYTNIWVYKPGIMGWQDAGKEIVAAEPTGRKGAKDKTRPGA
jgi:rhodanese-related sulfurtransferase